MGVWVGQSGVEGFKMSDFGTSTAVGWNPGRPGTSHEGFKGLGFREGRGAS